MPAPSWSICCSRPPGGSQRFARTLASAEAATTSTCRMPTSSLQKAPSCEDQLARIGGLADIPLRAAVPSPAEFNYRNHVQFHLNPSGKLGFRRAHSSEGLDIQECHLPEAEINEIWPQIEFDGLPELDRVGLRSGQGGEVQLILESEQPDAPEFSVELLPISAVHLSPAGTLVLAGRDYLLIEVNRRAFKVSAGSFFQVNTAVAGRMVDYLLESLPLSSEVTVLDAYCGVGLFSAFLAERAGRLIAVESSASAAEDFTVNLDEFDHVELYEAEVEQVLPNLQERVDVLVVDPPRAGLALPALDGILRLRPPVMAYISCDPATLARDAKRLVAGGYQLEEITPFDLFPQTFHIELISLWRSLSDSIIR